MTPARGALAIGIAALELGGGRRTKDDEIDHAVGVVCSAKRGQTVEAGRCSPTCTRVTRSRRPRARRGRAPPPYEIGDEAPPVAQGILLDVVGVATMPELPEVETVRSQLAPRLEGRTLARVEILDPRLTRPHDLFEVAEELEGDRVVAVERRGKYLLLRLESGFGLLVHLRMTGGFHWQPVTHERAVLELDDGTRLAYRDVRRFGTWLVLEGAELEPYLATKNGPEPLGPRFTTTLAGGAARRAARRRSRPCSSTSGSSRASGTSTRTRRSGARGSTRCAPANEL